MRDRPVVTAFLRRADGRILLVRRSQRVGSYQGRWSAISGHVEDVDPLTQAYREVAEETGIAADSLTLRAQGDPVTVEAEAYDTRWIVHPFLFDLAPGTPVRLDWENLEADWVRPEAFGGRPTVPKLVDAFESCIGKEGGE